MENIGRNAPCTCGSGKKTKQCCGSLVAGGLPASLPAPMIAALFQQGLTHHQAGRLTEAQSLYQRVLQAMPDHAEALHLTGVIALQRADYPAAVDLIGKAIRLRPSEHCHTNLGNALKELGRLDEAVASYRQALQLQPGHALAHCNLGNALALQGRTEEAIASCRQAIALAPRLAEAHANLGNALLASGATDEAIASYRQALACNPALAPVHRHLAAALRRQGQWAPATDSCIAALRLGETPETKREFILLAREAEFTVPHAGASAYLQRALDAGWAKPGELLPAAMQLIALDGDVAACLDRATRHWPQRLPSAALFGEAGLSTLAGNPLLRRLLETTPIASVAFERLLTMARAIVLADALRAMQEGAPAPEPEAALLGFCCAIARQCFINGYVHACTDDEARQRDALRGFLVAQAAANVPVPALCVAALAAYLPLSSLPCIDALSAAAWPDAVRALFRQQVDEPAIEQQHGSRMPRLTAIDDAVSQAVRQQYEEHPYPRWVGATQQTAPSPVDALIRHLFPHARYRPIGERATLDILVAGCGTGQHAIDAARQYRGARVLAIDLSLASLGYAKRKTDELGIGNIDYAQADILQLGALDKTFDLIESSGVLHHLADPVRGWRTLLGLLRPGGLMYIGLYSELARREVVAARAYIARRGHGATPEDIRRCRQELMADDRAGQFRQLLASRDFYSMSDCRDLLFHRQEHRFTIAQLQDILAALDLEFLGFMLDADTAARYDALFPDDRARTDLANWQAFESAHPQTFLRMYQFWVQRRATAAP